jgi:uncharacterized protein YkwD
MRVVSILVLGSFVLVGRAHAQIEGCADDARLSEAAAALSLEEHPTEESLMELVRAAGSEAPRAHALSVGAHDAARVAEWIASLTARGETPLACGEASTDAGRIIVAAPAAATLAVDGSHVSGHIASGWNEPLLYAEDADGEVVVVELTAPSFATSLPEGLEAIRLQVVARGPDGPRPVAERVLGVREADASASVDPRERVETLRREAGVLPLRTSRLFDRIAEEHAESVCEAGEAAHELEPGRDPSARLRAEGVIARHVGEVVARGVDVAHALDALAHSPSHRAALLDRRFTDVGIGTATGDDGHHCVVVVLTAWPRIVGRAPTHD